MAALKDSIDDIRDNMVTAKHLDAKLETMATKSALETLAARVADLERGTLGKVLGRVTTFAAGGVTIYAAVEAFSKLFGKGH